MLHLGRWGWVGATALALALGTASAQKAEPPYWYQDADDRATVYFVSSGDVPVGGYLAIYGDDFLTGGSVSLGGVAATVSAWSDRRIVVQVPSGASGPVVVNPTGGTASAGFPLAVTNHSVHHLDASAGAGGNGTAATPWRDFPTANANVSPGDQVVVYAGTYVGTGEAVLSANNGGTAAASVTYIAAPGEVAVLDATTTSKQAIRIDSGYVNVVGFVTHGGKYQNIYLNGPNARAIDCEVRDGDGSVSGKGQGININATSAKALGNYIHDNYSHGFYVHASQMEMGYNYVANSGCCGAPSSYGYGIQVYLSSGPVYSGAKVYRNYVTTANRSGIVIGQLASDTDVYENIVTGNDERGLIVNYGAANTTIRNNVFADNDTDGAGYWEIDLFDGTGAQVYNNAVVGPRAVYKRSGMGGTLAIDANLYSGSTNWRWDSNTYTSIAAWRSGTGNDAQGLSADPMFRNAASDDYRPAAGSPLIDSGNDTQCASPVSGAQCDIGAFEVVAGQPSSPPPAPANLRRTDTRP